MDEQNSHKALVIGIVAVIVGAGVFFVSRWMKAVDRAKEVDGIEEVASATEPIGSSESELRFRLTVNGTVHEVTDKPILAAGTRLTVKERPLRRFRDERFSFDYANRLRVGASSTAVTASDGAIIARLIALPRAEAEATRAATLADLGRMTGGATKERTRTIAGKPVAGKSVVAPGANREKELYWIELGERDALHVELLHPLGARLDDVLAMLASIQTGRSEPTPDFDLLAGDEIVAALALGETKPIDLPGGETTVEISNRPVVRRRIGRLSFEHPTYASVVKQTTPLGSGVQIGLDDVAITAMLLSGSASELESALMSQGVAAGQIEAPIGGKSRSGTALSMFGGSLRAEVYTVERPGETLVVMVQYSPQSADARSLAAPLLESLKAL